jgi:hypothetical protein
MLHREQHFERGTENAAPSAARIFQSQLFLMNFLSRQRARQEVLPKYSDTGEAILLKKYRKLRP